MATDYIHRDRSEYKLKQEQTLKDGERILAPTRRPDGTHRKAIRIRAGYVPQDEVAIYLPKPALQVFLLIFLHFKLTFHFFKSNLRLTY